MTTTSIVQLLGALTTFVGVLGGLAAYVATRLSRQQRRDREEIAVLRNYAEEVSRWGFRIRLLLANNGLDAPAMPKLPPEDGADDREDPGPAELADREAGRAESYPYPAAHRLGERRATPDQALRNGEVPVSALAGAVRSARRGSIGTRLSGRADEGLHGWPGVRASEVGPPPEDRYPGD